MYASQQGGEDGGDETQAAGGEDVVDAEFEEVDDNKPAA
jgi:molecular chaperone DnaK